MVSQGNLSVAEIARDLLSEEINEISKLTLSNLTPSQLSIPGFEDGSDFEVGNVAQRVP